MERITPKVSELSHPEGSKIISSHTNASGNFVVASDEKKKVLFYATGEDTPSSTLTFSSIIYSFNSSRVRNELLFGSQGGSINIHDLTSLKPKIQLTSHISKITSTSYSSEYSNLLVSGSLDNKARVWDLNSGSCIWTIKAHQKAINAVDMRNFYILTASDDGTTRVCL